MPSLSLSLSFTAIHTSTATDTLLNSTVIVKYLCESVYCVCFFLFSSIERGAVSVEKVIVKGITMPPTTSNAFIYVLILYKKSSKTRRCIICFNHVCLLSFSHSHSFSPGLFMHRFVYFQRPTSHTKKERKKSTKIMKEKSDHERSKHTFTKNERKRKSTRCRSIMINNTFFRYSYTKKSKFQTGCVYLRAQRYSNNNKCMRYANVAEVEV